VELAPYIRVNCVAPGWVDTEMNYEVFASERNKQAAINAIPLKRIATADDVALAVAYLASDWSRHVTGEVLNVNGGAVLCG
jgi:3-oxoacyl-[acyl-carrier protein] reductase